MDASAANPHFRVPRIVEEESASESVKLEQVARRTKISRRWKVLVAKDEKIEISEFRSWKRFQRL